MGGGVVPSSETKTVVVLGAAYGGAKAAQVLAAGLPKDWKLIVIDRNSHCNHVYVMPRFAVLSGHEHKAFIPYTNVFIEAPAHNPNHIVLKTHIVSIRPHHITISDTFPDFGIETKDIAFDYAVYALGAYLPSPLDLWGTDPRSPRKDGHEKPWVYTGFKAEAIEWLKERQKVIATASTVLVVGGGALGIQFATDIKAVHPEKKVTLLHSRKQLLPRFDIEMHIEVRKTIELQGIDLILGERLDLSSVDEKLERREHAQGQRIVRTESGLEIAADLVLLSTGQKPNTSLLSVMDPATINPQNHLAYVERTMQLTTAPVNVSSHTADVDSLAPVLETALSFSELRPLATSNAILGPAPHTYRHIFVVGDAADAFGAIAAGHTAYYQGIVAAQNIVKLVNDGGTTLEEYNPGPPAIKVSLGLTKSVYQSAGVVGVKDDGVPDLGAGSMWPLFGLKGEKDEDMYP